MSLSGGPIRLKLPPGVKVKNMQQPDNPISNTQAQSAVSNQGVDFFSILLTLMASGSYIIPNFRAFVSTVMTANGTTIEAAMKYLASMPEIPLKHDVIRRLIGNALDELVDEAVRRGHLAVLAAQPRAMVESKVLHTFGIDLRGGRSETYLDRASLFNQVKKTLRARGDDAVKTYDEFRSTQGRKAVFLIDKSVAIAGKSTGNNMQLAPPSSSSPPAPATAVAHTPELTGDIDKLINHKLDSILSQLETLVSRDQMVAYVGGQLKESEARSNAAMQSLETRLNLAIEAMQERLGRLEPAEEDLDGY